MAEAELARFIDRYTVEYVRTYPHPMERVWKAITDPKELGRWFIHGSRLDLKEGGEYWFGDDGFTGKVRVLDPPRFLRLGAAADDAHFFQYELSEVTGGTRLRFIEHFDPAGVFAETPDDLGGDLPAGPDTPWKPAFVGGWHEFWDALGDYLDGALTGSRLPKTEMSAIVDSFVAKMVANGRMTPENGQRIALGLRREERWNELNKVYRENIRLTCPPAKEE